MIKKIKFSLFLVLALLLSLASTFESFAVGTVSEPAQTLEPTTVTNSSATLNGMLSMEGADERGFEYGFTTSYGQSIFSGGNSDYSQWFTVGGAYGAHFLSPHSVAVDSAGNIYVTDNAASKVKKYAPGGGDLLLEWGSEGSGINQLHGPLGISTDSSNNVYVVDYLNSRIQKFDSIGNPLDRWGSAGTADGQFTEPTDIHINGNYVYVGDYRRVQRFDLDGNFDLSWDSYGGGCCFIYPAGIATDSDGDVYVAHNRAGSTYSIEKYDEDGNHDGQFVNGNGVGPIGRPSGIDIDELGNVYVSDFSYRVHKFDSSGALIMTWGDAGDPDRFQPYGVAYSSGYGLYFTDGEGIEGITRVIAINNRPSAELTGLACGSEYNYRAYARYGSQTYYGQNKTFVTEQGSDCDEPVNPPDPEVPGGSSSSGRVPAPPRTGKIVGFIIIFIAGTSLLLLTSKELRDANHRVKMSDK